MTEPGIHRRWRKTCHSVVGSSRHLSRFWCHQPPGTNWPPRVTGRHLWCCVHVAAILPDLHAVCQARSTVIRHRETLNLKSRCRVGRVERSDKSYRLCHRWICGTRHRASWWDHQPAMSILWKVEVWERTLAERRRRTDWKMVLWRKTFPTRVMERYLVGFKVTRLVWKREKLAQYFLIIILYYFQIYTSQ